jgi:hypothetical protein
LGGADREPPFFEFKSNRLVQWIPQPPYVPPNTIGTAPGYPSYLDGYGKTPYAYFSSYKTAKGYNRYANYMNPYLNLNTPPSGCQPVASDCQALPFTQWQTNALGQIVPVQGVGVWPYVQSVSPTAGTPNYLNPSTAQIISAGKDQNFGPGTALCTYLGVPWSGGPFWTPQTATSIYPSGQLGGYDDIANFYDRLLGVPTQ